MEKSYKEQLGFPLFSRNLPIGHDLQAVFATFLEIDRGFGRAHFH